MLATGVLDTDKVKKASSKSSKNKNDKYDTKLRVKCLNRKSMIMKMIITKAFRDSAQCASFSGSSLAGFGFFTYKGFMTGLNGTTDGGGTSGTFYTLSLPFVCSYLHFSILSCKKSNTIFAFLLPMLFISEAAYLHF